MTKGSFRKRLQGKVSDEDLWVGFDLILVRLCKIQLFMYAKGWLLVRIHVEVLVGSFRGQFLGELTLFYPGSGKTLLPRGGGGIMAPLAFSALGLPKAQN